MSTERLPRERSGPHKSRSPWPYLLPAAALAVAAVAVAAALLLVGSPAQQRRRWAEVVRAQDLVDVAYATDGYYRAHKSLPASLQELKGYKEDLRVADAVTGRPYTYRVLAPREYEVCAEFQTDTSRDAAPADRRDEHVGYFSSSLPFWKHHAGTHCFRLTLDAEGSSSVAAAGAH